MSVSRLDFASSKEWICSGRDEIYLKDAELDRELVEGRKLELSDVFHYVESVFGCHAGEGGFVVVVVLLVHGVAATESQGRA